MAIDRSNRNSLIAYGHLFEPRPQPRKTLRKKRSYSVNVIEIPAAIELPAAEKAPVRAIELAARVPEPSPFELAVVELVTDRFEVDVLDATPLGWTPPNEKKKPSAITPLAVARLSGEDAAARPILSPEQAPNRSTKQAHQHHHQHQQRPPSPPLTPPAPQRRSFSAPVFRRGYDPSFLMPVPPFKQPRSSTGSMMAGPNQPLNRGVSSDHYATSHNSSSSAMGPAYAQIRRPTGMSRQPMTNFDQMEQRMSKYDIQIRPSSSSSVGSTMTGASFGMMHSPSSSFTSVNSYESWDSSPRRPEYGAWQRPALIKQNRRKREQGELFRALPSEVLQVILSELRKFHLRPNGESCATCMMRDLCSVSLSCRRLSKFAQHALYEDIQIIGADSVLHKKRFKTTFGTRLVLLRRTLRSNTELASLVHTLKVPGLSADTGAADKYQDKVASVVMACPNFERLLGFHQPYDHSFSRLFHALSTRENLKEMNWFLEPPQAPKQNRSRSTSSIAAPQGERMSGDLEIEQSTAFADLHMDWTRLTTLSIHCTPGATLRPVSILGMALANMPALQHLHLSHLPVTAFNDTNLLSLPSLHTLSLSNLPGVSSAGLATFARRPSSHGIRKLVLRHLGVDSLPALGRVLSNLISLEFFAFVQSSAPVMPADEVIWLFPYMASSSLRKLHWDVPTNIETASEADRILAKSIASNGFPALRALRAPHDPEGVFQSLCMPIDKIEMASDKYRGLIARIPDKIKASEPSSPMSPMSPMSPRFGKNGNFKFPNEVGAADESNKSEESHLAQSRLSAQARLEAAKTTPRFFLNVVDEDGTILEKYGMGGFIGQIDSKIQYLLRPDPGVTDENGGLMELTDLLKDGGEDLKDREGCTGRWVSWTEGAVNDKKERERWWHTERGRWRELSLS